MSDLFARLAELPLHQVLGSRLPGLKKAGAEYKACCPLHGEKTPSFTLYEKAGKGAWKCFGCGKGGDAVDFVVLTEHLDKWAAAVRLAQENGVPVPERRPPTDAERAQRDAEAEARAAAEAHRAECLRCLALAQHYYVKALAADRPEAERARAYLAGRGLGADVPGVEAWGFGYAPDTRSLCDYLDGQGVTAEVRAAAGLTKLEENGREWRRFRNRVTLPIRDPDGRVLSFVARELPEGAG